MGIKARVDRAAHRITQRCSGAGILAATQDRVRDRTGQEGLRTTGYSNYLEDVKCFVLESVYELHGSVVIMHKRPGSGSI